MAVGPVPVPRRHLSDVTSMSYRGRAVPRVGLEPMTGSSDDTVAQVSHARGFEHPD
jgi:hypothetical protein